MLQLQEQMPACNPGLQNCLLEKLRKQQLAGGAATTFSASLFEPGKDFVKVLEKSCGNGEGTGKAGTGDRLPGEGVENTSIATECVLRAEESTDFIRMASRSNAQTACREGPSICSRQMPLVAPYLPERFGEPRWHSDTEHEPDIEVMS